MRLNFVHRSAAVLLGVLINSASGAFIDTVPVGNPGNPGDTRYPDTFNGVASFGGVSYPYNIGKHEVTAGQYAEFLNAVAQSDTYELYDVRMDYDANPAFLGCNIQQSGTDGNFTYSVAPEWANRPVNWVSWGDAARFVNWLHNGQPTGPQGQATTEDGAYFLNGAMSDSELNDVERESDWLWAVPTEDEWYKAAYHNNDGTSSNYWDYPTVSDNTPAWLAPPGVPNSANYDDVVGHTTEVGAYDTSPGPYGTFDQGGNVAEWNEAIVDRTWEARGVRGGSHAGSEGGMHAGGRGIFQPSEGNNGLGFRVVAVPEPGSLLISAISLYFIIRKPRQPG